MILRKTLALCAVLSMACLADAAGQARVVHGVALPSLPPGAKRESIVVAGATRTYILYVPASHDASKAAPLVFAFHGAGGTGDVAVLYFGLREKADEAGFILVCPDAAGPRRTWSWAAKGRPQKSGDVAFFEALLDKVERDFTIDPRRVYVAGHSSGGMLAHRLAADFPERIAAIAPVEGCIALGAGDGVVSIGNGRGPVSVLIIHGMNDTTIPYGPALSTDSILRCQASPGLPPNPAFVEGAVAFWVKADGCAAVPALESAYGGNVRTLTWSGGNKGTEVKLITIVNGSHGWPGAPAPWQSNQDVKAGAAIWDFFASHPRGE